MNIECVREAHEEIEERADIHGFGDLRIIPSNLPQALYLAVGDSVGVSRQRSNELQQATFGEGDGRAIEVAVTQGIGDRTVLLSLQLQEPCVAAQSVVTPIERRDIGGDHLVLGAREGAV